MTKSEETSNLVALVEILRKLGESQQSMPEYEDESRMYLLDKDGIKILL